LPYFSGRACRQPAAEPAQPSVARDLVASAAAISLLLFAGTIAIWIRSESHVDLFAWQRWPAQWTLDCIGGEVQLGRSVRGRAPSWREHDGFRRSSIKLYGRPETRKEEGTTRLVRHWGGFAYIRDDVDGYPRLTNDPSPRRLVIIPIWAVAVLAGILPVSWLRQVAARLRRGPRAASASA
jgi:hypothetical protein